jgi:DNA-binding transcriptional LysR family regulator
MRLDTFDLELFIHIAETGNLTHGAREAAISPPAASARLKALEERLGGQLFYRDSRGVELTPAGQTLLIHARIILRQVNQVMKDLARDMGEIAGKISIFANTTAVTEVFPEVFARFMADHPHTIISVQERFTRDVVRGVLDGAADVGMVAGPVATMGLTSLHFSTDRLVVVTPQDHPLSSRQLVLFDECLEYQLVGLRGSILQSILSEERKLQFRIVMASYEGICRMVEAGVGIGVIPEPTALYHCRNMRLSIVNLNEPWAIRERRVLMRERHDLSRSAANFVDWLMAYGAQSSSSDERAALSS